ncbi:MAG: entericidin A/B family lipoprotein [Halothiobacillus sp.]
MHHMIQKIVIVLLSSVFLLSIAGCSTMKGLGQDIKKGGQHLENAAESHGG